MNGLIMSEAAINNVQVTRAQGIPGITSIEAWPGEHYETEAQPLDRKVLGGVAILGSVSEDRLEELRNRVSKGFDQLRQDGTREYGIGIAYARDLSPVELQTVTQTLVDAARQQNHGIITRMSVTDGSAQPTIWSGEDSSHMFQMRFYSGPIPMDNGSMPQGAVYSLVGRPVN